jgi:Lrp/AsnC family transcriptional regulator, leucine-responsive regulatory protein
VDAVDSEVLSALMSDGRMTWADLSDRTGLSAPAVAERVHRLEDRGVIRGYAALVSGTQVGAHMTALVAVTLDGPAARDGFLRVVHDTVAVQECYHTAGDDDYLLKVRCGGTADLEHLVSDVLKGVPGVSRTRTTVVLSTVKESVVVPLPEARP